MKILAVVCLKSGIKQGKSVIKICKLITIMYGKLNSDCVKLYTQYLLIYRSLSNIKILTSLQTGT